MALLAMSNVVFTYALARSGFGFLLPLIGGVILMIVAVFKFHETAMMIALILLLSIGLIFLGTMGWYIMTQTSKRNVCMDPSQGEVFQKNYGE